jgi:hypothetical protein
MVVGVGELVTEHSFDSPMSGSSVEAPIDVWPELALSCVQSPPNVATTFAGTSSVMVTVPRRTGKRIR